MEKTSTFCGQCFIHGCTLENISKITGLDVATLLEMDGYSTYNLCHKNLPLRDKQNNSALREGTHHIKNRHDSEEDFEYPQVLSKAGVDRSIARRRRLPKLTTPRVQAATELPKKNHSYRWNRSEKKTLPFSQSTVPKQIFPEMETATTADEMIQIYVDMVEEFATDLDQAGIKSAQYVQLIQSVIAVRKRFPWQYPSRKFRGIIRKMLRSIYDQIKGPKKEEIIGHLNFIVESLALLKLLK